jgi:nitroimidazol reductase NimA-like FMN-containing flavoprotein (pyridoxamine 5'-phosphate oxidase superfamily)
MRRSDKEVTDQAWIINLLETALYCHIALADGSKPYIVQMNYAYYRGKLILHSAPAGEKVRILKQNPKISFAVEEGVTMVNDQSPCRYGMWYRSVTGDGYARIIQDTTEKKRLLKIFTAKYHHGPLPDFTPEALAGVLVIEIAITKVTGKISGYKV